MRSMRPMTAFSSASLSAASTAMPPRSNSLFFTSVWSYLIACALTSASASTFWCLATVSWTLVGLRTGLTLTAAAAVATGGASGASGAGVSGAGVTATGGTSILGAVRGTSFFGGFGAATDLAAAGFLL